MPSFMLPEQEAKSFLLSLGLKNLQDKGSYYSFSSPFREDKNPSMVCYKSTQYCVDFGGEFRGSLSWLCKKVTGKSIFQYLGIAKNSIADLQFRDAVNEIKPRRFPILSEPKEVIIEGTIHKNINADSRVTEFCESRYLTKEFRKYFDIGYCYEARFNGTFFKNRLCIPINEKGKLISVEGRDFTRKQKPKVLYPKGGYVSTLFNLDNLNREEDLIVVEGIMDVTKIWMHVTKNVTTTFGIMITSNQAKLLNQFKHVILFPDGDDGGYRFINNMDAALEEREFDVAIIDGYDPDDLDLKTLEQVIEDRKPANEFLLKKSGLFEEKDLSW